MKQSWRTSIPDTKMYYKAIEIKILYWHKNRQIGQWGKNEFINMPRQYSHSIYDKGITAILWTIRLSINCHKLTGDGKGWSLPHTMYINIHSKWITDLNVKSKELNLPEDYMGKCVLDLRSGKYFFKKETPKALSINEKINKLDFV